MDTWFHGHLSDEKDEKPEDFGAPHLGTPNLSILPEDRQPRPARRWIIRHLI